MSKRSDNSAIIFRCTTSKQADLVCYVPTARRALDRQRALAHAARARGKAVQVEPMKPMSKAPGTERLKLKYDKLLSSFAFNFNLRRYNVARSRLPPNVIVAHQEAGPGGHRSPRHRMQFKS